MIDPGRIHGTTNRYSVQRVAQRTDLMLVIVRFSRNMDAISLPAWAHSWVFERLGASGEQDQ